MTGRVHLVGIGGIGMSALAQILLARGVEVSGSDAQESAMTERLAKLGAAVTIGHRGQLVEGATRVVASDAIAPDNAEMQRAREKGLPVQRRSELLAELALGHRMVAAAGTHGKTTVTAMIGAILVQAGADPTVVLGGEYGPLGGNARVGEGDWFVVEACEAYESFLDLRPEVAVITNVEPDHLDHHKTEAHLRESFGQFLRRIEPGGCAVLCADRPELRELSHGSEQEVKTYGLSPEAEVRGTEVELQGLTSECRLWVEGREAGRLRVGAPGMHNVVNALGAVSAALAAGAALAPCREALAEFTGVGRRFEVLAEVGDVVLVDDYAHHPTEIAATVAAARVAFPGRRLVAVFQPHLYTRTRDFAEQFAQALGEADVVVLTDIYPAREAALPGVTSELIAKPLHAATGKDVRWAREKGSLPGKLAGWTRPGDVVLFLGAGDIGQVAREAARGLGARTVGKSGIAAKK
jgi:UDP-N-acetylmuramate--alanine ligase